MMRNTLHYSALKTCFLGIKLTPSITSLRKKGSNRYHFYPFVIICLGATLELWLSCKARALLLYYLSIFTGFISHQCKSRKEPYPWVDKSVWRVRPQSDSRTETGWGNVLPHVGAECAGTTRTEQSGDTAAGGWASQPAWSSGKRSQSMGLLLLLSHLVFLSPSPVLVPPKYPQNPAKNSANRFLKTKTWSFKI